MKNKVYVASSWRNEYYDLLVNELRCMGFKVYDFKRPDGKITSGFQWSRIDKLWKNWDTKEFREHLNGCYAQFGFNRDFDAMKSADICVMCLPCGRSAHLEAGWMKGAGKKVFAFIPLHVNIEPELMYGMLDGIALNIQELIQMLKED